MNQRERDAALAWASETLTHCRRYATGDTWATRQALEGVRDVIHRLRAIEESLAERLSLIERA